MIAVAGYARVAIAAFYCFDQILRRIVLVGVRSAGKLCYNRSFKQRTAM